LFRDRAITGRQRVRAGERVEERERPQREDQDRTKDSLSGWNNNLISTLPFRPFSSCTTGTLNSTASKGSNPAKSMVPPPRAVEVPTVFQS
jgi:hypothetical protein